MPPLAPSVYPGGAPRPVRGYSPLLMAPLRSLGILVVAVAAAWHLLTLLSPAWMSATRASRGRDFASYYYAARVAAEGGDPYDKQALAKAAREDGSSRGVHPFLYAPPFLLLVSWTPAVGVETAYRIWFWLHELASLLAVLVLWRWWRPLGPHLPVLLAVVFALMTAIPNNHAMGQANFAGLALALAGLWQTDERRPWLGGALMGAACMLKMSPALWVFWWIARREYRAVAGAVLAGLVLSLLTLPLAGLTVQLGFYTDILPTFGSGDYNGLSVPIGLFGNHSIPNLIDALLPGEGGTLAPAARAISGILALALLGSLTVLFADPPAHSSEPRADQLQRAAQAACIGVLILLVPVYTYEHHLVFALPAAVIALHAAIVGRLERRWLVPVALCVGVLLFDLRGLRGLAQSLPRTLDAVAAILRELKFAALVGLLAATAVVGARAPVRQAHRPRQDDGDAPAAPHPAVGG